METQPASIDTLAISKRLQKAGAEEKLAEEYASIFRETVDNRLATKDDLRQIKEDLEERIGHVESRLGDKIETKIASLRKDIAGKADAAQIELLRRDLTIRMGTMLTVAVGLIFALHIATIGFLIDRLQ